jgi:hypothetical protein
VGTLLRRELGTRAAVAGGDVVTPVLARAATQEWEWARGWSVALVRFLMPENQPVIERWMADWMPAALAACAALAPEATERVRAYADGMLADAMAGPAAASGPAPAGILGPPSPPVDVGRQAGIAPAPRSESSEGSYDYVGIVMAKSAEGDAVARLFAGRAEVLEQAAFWEIRARDRLVIAFDEIANELGYDVDGYSIQYEMSTHYGRLVVTDEALMLFSDPTDAMQHLLS